MKHIADLINKYKKRYKLNDKQAEQLARAARTGRAWGIRRGFGIKIKKKNKR